MRDCANEERYPCGDRPAQFYSSGGGVDVPPEEIVHRDIPFPAEFEPVKGVPPVRVELPVCEACYLRESAEDVFEDGEED